MGKNSDLSERFFAAVTAGDNMALRAMCIPGAGVSQNGAPELGMDEFAALGSAVGGVMPDYHYENVVCSDTEDGFVSERDGLGTLPDGTLFEIHSCMVATVDDGKISGMREYFDSASVAPLLKAFEE
jgi:ketosteroid isomerase-like protein